MDEFKNNKDGKIEELKVCHSWGSHLAAAELSLFPGQHIEAEIGSTETFRDCQNSTKRAADCDA